MATAVEPFGKRGWRGIGRIAVKHDPVRRNSGLIDDMNASTETSTDTSTESSTESSTETSTETSTGESQASASGASARDSYARDAGACWRAVQARDASARSFVYAVLSTGVFCVAGCPSRLPRRDNVLFYPGATAAEQAGFRACLRCRPRAARIGAGARMDGAASWLTRACRSLESDPGQSITALAHSCGVGRTTLHRAFVRTLGLAPADYRAAVRGARLRTALALEGSVTDAVHAAGFSGPSRAYAAAHAELGLAPGQLLAGGAGLRIRCTAVECALGRMLLAFSETGLCLVEFLDADEAPELRVRARFPRAECVAGALPAESDVAAAVRALEAQGNGAAPQTPPLFEDIPLDIRGTAFQRRVWAALRRVGCGERISYGELAARIGSPQSARAVAQACGSNPLAVLVPCHRVVAADGSAGGYRWGVARKLQLLARERGRDDEAGEKSVAQPVQARKRQRAPKGPSRGA